MTRVNTQQKGSYDQTFEVSGKPHAGITTVALRLTAGSCKSGSQADSSRVAVRQGKASYGAYGDYPPVGYFFVSFHSPRNFRCVTARDFVATM